MRVHLLLVGQLGDGTLTTRRSAVSEVLSGVSVVAAGAGHTCALMMTGGLLCWGLNDQGQLGDGTLTNTKMPPQNTLIDNVDAVAAGTWHTCIIVGPAGGVRCFGANDYWQLGVEIAPSLGIPESDVLVGASAVAAGEGHTCALLDSGRVLCWGSNAFGQVCAACATCICVCAVDFLLCTGVAKFWTH